MTKLMSKSELIQKVADQHSLSKKDVKSVIESLASVGYKELKKNGAFLLPGFAKFVVIKKPATKERQGSSGESSKRRGVSKLLALADEAIEQPQLCSAAEFSDETERIDG